MWSAHVRPAGFVADTRRRRGLAAAARVVVVAGLLVTAACGGAGDSAASGFDTPASPSANRVTAQATALTLDGLPWWPVGINAPQLGTDYALNHGCGAQVDPQEFFAALPPGTLTRINVFQAFAVPKDAPAMTETMPDARAAARPVAAARPAAAPRSAPSPAGSLASIGGRPDGAPDPTDSAPAPADGAGGEAVPASGMDFDALDAVFAAAAENDQMVLPVLAPGDGVCGDQRFKDRAWFDGGWRTADPVAGRSVVSFADWVRTAVTRYRGSPVLAGWELVGEPEPLVCGPGGCGEGQGSCPADAAEVLRGFFDDAGAIVRDLDPGRLIFAGLIGGGQCGSAGGEYAMLGASDAVDVLEYHDYGAPAEALPGDRWNGLAVRIDQAEQVGKPLLVAEIGVDGGACRPLLDRRDLVVGKIDGQRSAGTAGALLWAYVPDPRTGGCTYDIGPDDPLMALLGDRAAAGSGD